MIDARLMIAVSNRSNRRRKKGVPRLIIILIGHKPELNGVMTTGIIDRKPELVLNGAMTTGTTGRKPGPERNGATITEIIARNPDLTKEVVTEDPKINARQSRPSLRGRRLT